LLPERNNFLTFIFQNYTIVKEDQLQIIKS
jgi:hypothetical protein